MSTLTDTLGWSEYGIEVEAVTFDVGTVRAMALLPVIPDDAPDPVREGIARRRIATIEGRCPCGVGVDYSQIPRGAVTHRTVNHRDHCPAITRNVRRALRRWRQAA